VKEMLERDYGRNTVNGNNQNRNRNEAYRRRTDELRTSQHFWKGDRIIPMDTGRIAFGLIIGIATSIAVGVLCITLIQNELISFLVAILSFVAISILAQPQIYYKVRSAFYNLPKASIENVELMDDIHCFFYRDVDTEELHKEVLFTESRGRIAGFGMFKMDTIPISISGNLNQVVRALYGQKIPIFWNYVQAPITEKQVKNLKNVSLDMRKYMDKLDGDTFNSFILNKQGVWEARIVFGTSYSKKILTNVTDTIQEVYENVKKNLDKLESAFLVHFPHSKIVLLEDKDLLAAKRVQITDGGKFRFF
jgi:hypothetical protein